MALDRKARMRFADFPGMMHPPHSKGQALSLSALGFGSRTGAVIATCFAIATAHALGAKWLSEPFAYLPAGMWIIGFALLLAHALESGAFAALGRVQRWSLVGNRSMNSRAIEDAVEPVVNQAKAIASDSIDVVRSALENVDRASRRLVGKNDHELHIGLDMTAADAAALILTSDSLDPSSLAGVTVRFTRAEPGLVKDGPVDAERFDALLRRGSDNALHLFVPEREGAPAAWADWSNVGDLSYTSVFPVRLDCSRVALGQVDLTTDVGATLVSRLAIAGAALGRTPARVGNTRTFLGSHRCTIANFAAVVPAALGALADALMMVSPKESMPCCKPAARVLSAFLAGGSGDKSDNDRLHLLEAACAFIADEPEANLRLGAVRASFGQRGGAEKAFLQASRTIKAERLTSTCDATPFILGEAELGNGDRLSYGRVCAGLALLCATSKPESLAYMNDDLIDDLTHAGWGDTRRTDLENVSALLVQLGAPASKPKHHKYKRAA